MLKLLLLAPLPILAFLLWMERPAAYFEGRVNEKRQRVLLRHEGYRFYMPFLGTLKPLFEVSVIPQGRIYRSGSAAHSMSITR